MGNRTELENEIASFQRRLATYLGVFGIGMIAINAAAILLGLQPLRRVRRALALVREGNAQRLDGRFPAEIEPLANETNALIENNKRIVERSRTQVGNLAHSLKTPLAVMLNEGRALGGDKGRLIVDQAIGHADAGRALSAARPGRRAARQRRLPHAGRRDAASAWCGWSRSSSPSTAVTLSLPAEEVVFAGEREDLEEIAGNLLDNAMKWAKSKVAVSVRPEPGGRSGRRHVRADHRGRRPGHP